ncbi:MAG: SMP-30/gluconolactonase/LRE family protein [Myxococcales bacterium]|nr:SMP-30/gluconolactonase/LRE family protein [Myxococcales bacterium]
MRLKTARVTLMAVALLLGCGSDPGPGAEASDSGASAEAAALDAAPAAILNSASASAPTTATPLDSSVAEDPMPDASGPSDSGADSGSDLDAGTASKPEAATCPEGPLATRPFEGASVTASEVCAGFTFTEGPVWVPSRGALLFSDFQIGMADQNYPGRIIEHRPGADCQVLVADIGANGLALAGDGRVLVCRHDLQVVGTLDPITLATDILIADYQGTAFSSPNDITVRSDGTVYFTDPAWQIGNRSERLPQRAYRRVPAGELHVIDDIPRANGITLSPDGGRLYVSNGDSVRAYALGEDGSTSTWSPFVDSGSDGMTVDCAGNLYITTAGVVRVHDPEATLLGEIQLPEGADTTTNVAFGGPERRTLFITGGSKLYAIDLAIPGWPH